MNLHHHIVREHKTYLVAENENGRITIRKDKGYYNVKLWDKHYKKRITMPFKTEKGALLTADLTKETYL